MVPGAGGTGASAHVALPAKTYASAVRSTEEEDDARIAAILRKVGALVDGRLAAILDRLPPEPPGKFRPPLGGEESLPHPTPTVKGNKKAPPGAAGRDSKAPPRPARERSPWPLQAGWQ